MKQKQLNQLYKQLEPKEQAALAFDSIAAKRYDEFDLILSCVARNTYETPDLEYMQRIEGLMQLAGFYGVMFWKTMCQLSLVTIASSDKVNYLENTQYFQNKLTTMDAALNVVCERLNVAPKSIRYFAECSAGPVNFEGEVDAKLLEEYQDMFSKLAKL